VPATTVAFIAKAISMHLIYVLAGLIRGRPSSPRSGAEAMQYGAIIFGTAIGCLLGAHILYNHVHGLMAALPF
jgi:hypothetical protein